MTLKQTWPSQLMNPTTEAFFTDTPKVVGIEITGRCQLRCRHCFNESGPDNPHELPLPIIEKLLDEMLEWGVHHLRVSGGEPTFHHQFKELMEACRQRGISIGMNTHGIYSANMLEYLKQAPIEMFMISVDGLEENNNAIRGKGLFKRAVNSCRVLHKAGQNVMMALHVGMGNKEDVQGLVELAADIGINIKISPIRPIGRAVKELPSELIQPAVYMEVVEKIVSLRKQYPHIKIFTDFDILENSLPNHDCQRDPLKASCKAGRTMVNINYDGEIYPCAFFATANAEFSAGNLYETSVSAVWAIAPEFQPFRIQTKSSTCQSCGHYQKSCVGGCPAIAHFTTGYLDAHDPTCFADQVKPPEASLNNYSP